MKKRYCKRCGNLLRIYLIELNKPIAYQDYLNNYKLGQMANLYDKNMTWLSIVNTIIFGGGVSSPAGVANSLASAIGSSPSKLRTAYDRGQHCYVVSVYANGVKPSLSKIAYVYYTNQTLRFVEK